MGSKLKITGLVVMFLMCSGMTFAQTNYDATSENNPNFGDGEFSKQSFLDKLTGFTSELSFFQAPKEAVKPGEEVRFRFENDISYQKDAPYSDDGGSLFEENAKYIVEVYDCGVRCGDDDEFIDGIRFQNFDLETGSLSSGDTVSGGVFYTIPERSDGPHSVTAYVWVQEFTSDNIDNDGDGRIDEDDEALVSDTPGAEFTVSGDAPEGSDRTVTPDKSFSDFVFDNLVVILCVVTGLVLIGAYYYVTRE